MVIGAIVGIGFIVLAIASLEAFGLWGILVWIVIYALFHSACRALLRHIGE